jgi:hypothetical protein
MAVRSGARWSQRVAERSNALDLEPGVFTLKSPRQIALSLKRSAERSTRRKAEPFRSAMSMLTFYVNRAGRQLPAADRRRFELAKDELRALFGRRRKQARPGAASRRATRGGHGSSPDCPAADSGSGEPRSDHGERAVLS